MKIIIVGCGKVGYTLAEQLSTEDHDLVMIDEKEGRLDAAKEKLDAIGVVGDGVSFKTLQEAGIMEADLLIAVTDSDEQNLLCCMMAKKGGNCKTIARVRNPHYSAEIEFFKKEFGLAMVINPEYETAIEISRVFQFPSAIKIDTFVNGRVELLHFRVKKDSLLDGEAIHNIRDHYNENILISGVTRGDQFVIPSGDFVLQANDRVSLVGVRRDAVKFFKKIGMMSNRVRSAMIAGGGKISYYLAQSLLRAGIEVTIVELDRKRCEMLTEIFPDATIICGDASDQYLLEQEGLEDVEGFVALTGLDEENILMSLYAKGVSNGKIITKINRITFASVIESLDLDCVMNPRLITAEYILRYVRSLQNSEDSNVENLYMIDNGKAEAMSFKIRVPSLITDTPIEQLNLRKNILICSIWRNGKIIIPTGQDKLLVNDTVVVVSEGGHITDIKNILKN